MGNLKVFPLNHEMGEALVIMRAKPTASGKKESSQPRQTPPGPTEAQAAEPPAPPVA